MLPQLREIEERYPDRVVVIGVHSAKFPQEKSNEAVAQAVRRHGIRHPVVNDADFAVWQAFTCRAWPTLMFIDPRGKVIGRHEGEFEAGQLMPVLDRMLAEFDDKGWLAPAVPDFGPVGAAAQASIGTDLAFPGGILVDDRGRGHITIADSNHHRLVVVGLSTLGGPLHHMVGTGEPGLRDGPPEMAQFNWPQGLAIDPRTGVVYIADTENHAIRRMSPDGGTITTIAGTGRQARTRGTGGPARGVDLSSPWDVVFLADPAAPPITDRGAHDDPHDDRGLLFIAMAGTHQIWVMDLASGRVIPFAGSGSEALADGPVREAAFAQPSGLAIDGTGERLWVADSETSAVRQINLGTGQVSTLVGQGLFDFGDIDGNAESARLQHPLGVTWWRDDPDGESLLIADTYNHRIKRLDLTHGTVRTFIGGGPPEGHRDGNGAEARFSEPGDLAIARGRLFIADTNNHVVRSVDLTVPAPERVVETIKIDLTTHAH